MILSLLCPVPGLLGLFQLLLQGCNLLLGCGQLVFGLAKLPSLTFNLPFSPFQGSLYTLLIPVYLGQLVLQLLHHLLSHVEGIYSRNAPSFFLLHHPMRAVHHLLDFERSLDGLGEEGDIVFFFFLKEKKKLTKNKVLTMARSLFRLRNILCFLMDLRSAMLWGSNRDCSTAWATYLALPC